MKKLYTKCVLVIVALLSSFSFSFGQTIQLGNGTSTTGSNTSSPINIWYRSNHCQIVYTASELNTAGVFAGDLSQIGFYINSAPIYNLPNFTIKIKHTSAIDVSIHDSGIFQTVYQNNSYAPQVGGFDMLMLSTPFSWNGVDNIILDVCFDRVPAYNQSGTIRYYSNTNGYRYIWSDGSDMCGVNTSGITTYKPQCKMEFINSINGTDNAGISSINPLSNICQGTYPIYSTITNYGNNPIDSVTVGWSINNVLQSSNIINTNLDTLGGGNIDTTILLGNASFINTQSYDIKVWTSMPNGNIDSIPSNDTLSTIVNIGLNGTYTIGGTSPDYSTLTAAVNDLHTYGICGAVTFNIRDDNYNEQLTINEITGVDSTNTITFQSENGDSTQVIVTSTLSSSSQNIIQLNGADWITFRGLTLESNQSSGYSRIIQLYNGAEHNTFENNVIRGRNVSSTSTYYALIYSNGDQDNFTTIRNNHLEYGSYGVYLRGANTSSLKSGLVIENNFFENQYYYGVYLLYEDAPKVINNVIETNSTYSSSRGIFLQYCDNQLVVANNRIEGVRNFGLYLQYCDATNANKARIFNNYIYMPNGGYGLSLYYGSYLDISNNTVHLNGNYGLYDEYGSFKNYYNNIFSNDNGYAARVYSIGSINQIDNNAYYNGNGGSPIYGYSSFVQWQTSTNLDANSYNANPGFITNDSYQITNPLLNNTAIPLGYVTQDIEGNPRSATPDIGVYEFVPPPLPTISIAPTSVAATITNCSDSTTTSFKVYNTGAATLYYNLTNNSYVSPAIALDSLAIGDSAVVVLNIYNLNQNTGIYNTSINITSNDVTNSLINLPIQITTVGVPTLTTSVDTIDFGSMMVNLSSSQNISILNTGCSILNVSNSVTSNAAFTVNNTSFNLNPNGNTSQTITFSPTTLGNFSETLTFTYNGGTQKSIVLLGQVVAQPSISVSPSSLTTTINTCNDSITLPLVVTNSGNGDLVYSLSSSGGGNEYLGSSNLSTQYYTSTGASTFHNFSNVPSGTDSLRVYVTLSGDFNSSSEYAELIIDGSNQGIIDDSNPSTNIVIYRNYYYGSSIVNNWIANGIISIEIDNNSGVHTTQGGLNRHQVQLFYYSQSVGWLLANANDTITGMGSDTIPFQFNSTGLNSGTYSTMLDINSNDPNTPMISVPVSLTVNGFPNISASTSSLFYGDLMVGAVNLQTITLTNTGCDTLDITNIQATDSDYSMSVSSLFIYPGQSATVTVTFSPTSIGSHSATLNFTNNATPLSISLQGNGLPAPDIVVTPIAITDTAFSCTDTLFVPIVIENTGTAILNYNLLGISEVLDSSSETYTTSGATTSHLFNNLPNTADTIRLTITMNGDFDQSNEYAYLYIDGSSQNIINDGNVVNGTDIIVEYIFTNQNTINNWLSNGQLNIQITNTSAVNSGFTGVLDFHKVKLEIRNESWVEVSSSANNLQVGNTDTTYVRLVATDLANATYSSAITINSDDPTAPVVTIPISFTVQGTPEIALQTDTIDFGGQIITTTNDINLIINNPSCATLDITNIISTDTAYTVSDTLFSIPPFSSNTVAVTFAPGQIINYPATLTILNNDTTQVITLTGQGLAKPIISTDTDSINVNFTNCDDTIIVPVTIYNTGAGILDYNITEGSSIIFSDDFENGSTSNWTQISNGHNVTTTFNNPASGNYSLQLTGSGYYQGLHHSLGNSQPNYISYKLKSNSNSAANGYFVLRDNSGNEMAFIIIYSGAIRNYYGSGSYLQTPCNTNQWYLIELKNIDYSANTYNFYIDGQLIQSNLSFRYAVNSISSIDLFNYHNTTSYYDDIIISGNGNLISQNTLTAQPNNGTVSSNDSTIVNVTLTSSGLSNGSYSTNLNINSTDPDNPVISIPVSVTINGGAAVTYSEDSLTINAIGSNTGSTSFNIANTGCAELQITNITTTNPVFSTSWTSQNIAAYSNQNLNVYLSASATGVNTAWLFITSNLGVDSIYVEGLKCSPRPTITASGSLALCSGQSVTLTSSYSSNIVWNTGETTTSITVNQAGYYYVTHTDGLGCNLSSYSTQVTGIPNASITVNQYSSSQCPGGTVVITAYNGTSYNWSTGQTTPSITVNPTVTTTYNVTVTNSYGCTYPLTANINVSNPVPLATVNNLQPSGGVSIFPPSSFGWTATQGAVSYDFFVWEQGASIPTSPTISNINVTGVYHNGLDYGKIYEWKVRANAICSSASSTSATETFSTDNLPDNIIATMSGPTTGFSSANITLSWTVTNIGLDKTPNYNWFDGVYLSNDTIFGNDFFLGDFFRPNTLLAGQSYTQTQTVNLPNGVSGTFYVFVKTDRSGTLPEEYDNNNTAFQPIQITLTIPPDLEVTNFAAPDTVFSDQYFNYTYTVTNTGLNVTQENIWKDYIRLSTDTIYDSGDQLIAIYTHTGTLASGAAYTKNLHLNVPAGTSGAYYLVIKTDAANQVYEHNSENNNTYYKPVIVNIPPYPNLFVNSINAPDSVTTNGNYPISWIIGNNGNTGTNTGNWTDLIYISYSPIFNANSAFLLDSLNYTGGILGSGGATTNQIYVTIPPSMSGQVYFHIITDANNNVNEGTGSGESDNGGIGLPIQVVFPDFIVTNLSVPTNGVSGQAITVSWTTENQGLIAQGGQNRIDYVYINNGGVNTLIGQVTYSNNLAIGQGINLQTQVTIPNGYNGNYTIIVKADGGNSVNEGSGGESNNLASTGINITLDDWADLQAINLGTLPSSATANNTLNFSYSGKNAGLKIANPNWTDEIQLLSETNYNNSNIVASQSIIHNNSLGINQTIAKSGVLNLPYSLDSAMYYVFINIDKNNDIFEHTDESNNIVFWDSIYINGYPPSDLAITNAVLPDTMQSGLTTNVQWEGENLSTYAILTNSWRDGLILSTDTILNYDSTDFIIKDFSISGTLNGLTDYTKWKSVIVPQQLGGNYYAFINGDRLLHTKDSDRSNNVYLIRNPDGSPKTHHVDYTEPVDLQFTNFSVNPTVNSGQPIKMYYTVQNFSTYPTAVSAWIDQVYLSIDNVLDVGDNSLGFTPRNGVLQPGASYSDSLTVTLPTNISGNYTLIMATDAINVVFEDSMEFNNTALAFLNITAAPPSDLVVSNINAPDTASSNIDFDIEWIIENTSNNPAIGLRFDEIRISQDNIWDNSDTQFEYLQNNNTALGQNNTETNTATNNKNLSGDYFILVKTNINGNINENNLNNNVLSKPIHFRQSVTTNISQTVCQGTCVSIGSQQYCSEGTHTILLTAYNGIDSLVILDLTVNSSSSISQYITICQGESISIGTNTYNSTGTYTNVLTNIYSCDSIITTHLLVNPTHLINQSFTICQGQSIPVGINNYSTTGIYTDTLMNIYSCDSIVITDLLVNPTHLINQNFTICQGQSIPVGMNNYNTTGIYTDTLLNIYGCDSIVITDLLVNPTHLITQNFTICQGQSIPVGMNNYNMTGIYTDTLMNIFGCDSIVITDLTVLQPTSETLNEVICQGQSYTLLGQNYTTNGTFIDTTIAANGCDSIITLNLIVNNVDSTFVNDTICAGTTYDFDGTMISTSGIYQNVYTNVNGCDSTVILDLLVAMPLEVSDSTVIDVIGATLGSIDITISGGIEPYSYIWSNGDTTEDPTNLPIDFYSVLVTDAIGCQTSSTFGIVNTKYELSFNVFKVYPNPTTGQFSVNAEFATPLDDVRLEVRSINGQIVRQIELGNAVTTIQESLNLDDLPSASYIVILRSGDKKAVKQILLTK